MKNVRKAGAAVEGAEASGKEAAGGRTAKASSGRRSAASLLARLGLFLTDLKQFATVNSIMAEYFHAPYPARSTVQVAALPKGAPFEVEATLVLA